MLLFTSAHFLYRTIILCNPWVKVLRVGKQTAELSLLKWYWTLKKVFLYHPLAPKKLPELFRVKQRMFQFHSVQLQSVTFEMILNLKKKTIKEPFCANGSLGWDGGWGGNLQISLVSCVRASTFPVKGDISSSHLICPGQWLGLRRFYGTFAQQRAFQLTKCVDYHQSLNNKPVQSCPICLRWEITGSLWLASHILYTSASWSLTPFSRHATPSIILLRKQ